MAERAVLLRGRSDGSHDAERSRWGGTDSALASVLSGAAPETLPGVDWRPWRTGRSVGTLLDEMDFLGASICYRVHAETTAFLVLWSGLPLAEESAGRHGGALVAVHSLEDARRLRHRFRLLKGALADALVTGSLPIPVAPFVLVSWVDNLDDRETYLSPAFRSVTEG